MTAPTDIRTPGTPKPWMNTMVRTTLRVPGLRRVLGKAFAVVTVTGARTGTRYSTPVQYVRIEGEYVVLSQVHRRWWRNVATQPRVELLVQGRAVAGNAVIAAGDAARRLLTALLLAQPRVARFYGIREEDGVIAPGDVDALLERVVVIAITPVDDGGVGRAT